MAKAKKVVFGRAFTYSESQIYLFTSLKKLIAGCSITEFSFGYRKRILDLYDNYKSGKLTMKQIDRKCQNVTVYQTSEKTGKKYKVVGSYGHKIIYNNNYLRKEYGTYNDFYVYLPLLAIEKVEEIFERGIYSSKNPGTKRNEHTKNQDKVIVHIATYESILKNPVDKKYYYDTKNESIKISDIVSIQYLASHETKQILQQ